MHAERIEAKWIDAFQRVFVFDLPVRGCTITLDGAVVVDAGRPVDPA